MIATRPAYVVQPAGTGDVVRAVSFARDHGLPVAVRGGGHNIAGTAHAPGGLTLDMSGLRGVDVDPIARTATVQAGLPARRRRPRDPGARPGRAARLLLRGRRGRPHARRRDRLSLAPLRLDRRQPARGRDRHRRRAGAPREPRRARRPVLGAARGRSAARRGHRVHVPAARGRPDRRRRPDRVAVRARRRDLRRVPDLQRRGAARARGVAARRPRPRGPVRPARVAWRARLRDGRLLQRRPAPRRRWRRSARSASRCSTWWPSGRTPRSSRCSTAASPRASTTTGRASYLAELSDGFLETFQELAGECPIPLAQIGILHLGGALNEREDDDGAVGNRDARYVYGLIGAWAPDEPQADAFRDWIRDGLASASGRSAPAAATSTSRAPTRARTASARRTAPTTTASMEIKRAYDPGDVFAGRAPRRRRAARAWSRPSRARRRRGAAPPRGRGAAGAGRRSRSRRRRAARRRRSAGARSWRRSPARRPRAEDQPALQRPARQLGAHEPGHDHRQVDARAAQLEPHGLRDAEDGVLAGRVDRLARHADLRRRRGDVDHVARARARPSPAARASCRG